MYSKFTRRWNRKEALLQPQTTTRMSTTKTSKSVTSWKITDILDSQGDKNEESHDLRKLDS